ncbi:MAG: mannose-1-phosphate guanylyltransferase [Phycisphaerae bacterium]|nr:mannose-1-phosphate guanylyltransferase [Phycisphaerae bacterium]
MRYAMVMAGGAGTRLWPMSRKDRPKQLLRFIEQGGGPPTSLLELAVQRLEGLIPPSQQYICTAEAYRGAILEALPGFEDHRILGEPMGRDTVNAVGLAAAVFEKVDPEAVFAVLTADHIIEPHDRFRELMDLGFRLVEADPTRLVTFSIKPTYPATGFGYVERGAPLAEHESLAFKVARFVEKPDRPRAEAYVQSGVFGWNSGMFVWRASTVMSALERFKPESFAGLKEVQAAWGTPRQREVLERVYPTLPKTSVDYALMEPATKARDRSLSVCTVQMELKWLDVGSWPSYGQTLEPDKQGNRQALGGAGGGKGVLVGTSGTLLVNTASGHTVALLGCKDLIVVHTPDATLVMPRERAEELKELHGQVEDRLK